jgi:uncharacterized protein YqeY
VTLQERLIGEMKEAMKTGDTLKVSVIRMLRSSIKNKEIEKGKSQVLSENEIIELISSAIKQRGDSVEQFAKGGRTDLVEKEEREIQILKTYLPTPLSEEELRRMIQETLRESGAAASQDLGRVMKAIMPKVVGRADGAAVSRLVKEMLG